MIRILLLILFCACTNKATNETHWRNDTVKAGTVGVYLVPTFTAKPVTVHGNTHHKSRSKQNKKVPDTGTAWTRVQKALSLDAEDSSLYQDTIYACQLDPTDTYHDTADNFILQGENLYFNTNYLVELLFDKDPTSIWLILDKEIKIKQLHKQMIDAENKRISK